jgi:acetolactate synthase regulatory subunit
MHESTAEPADLALVVAARDRPEVLQRILSTCQRRGWRPRRVTWIADGTYGQATLRLFPHHPRAHEVNLAAYLIGLVDVLDVVSQMVETIP